MARQQPDPSVLEQLIEVDKSNRREERHQESAHDDCLPRSETATISSKTAFD